MNKKVLKRILVCVLCMTMVMSSMTAFATEVTAPTDTTGTEVTGNNDVENPVFRVVVPTTLTFATDPFELKAESMIYSPDYPIINKSNIAVLVDVGLSVTGATAVTFVESAEGIDETVADKSAWFAAAVPATVTETSKEATNATVGTTPVNVYNVSSATGGAINVKAADEDAAKVAAALVDGVVFVSGAALTITQLQETDIDTVEGTYDFTDLVAKPLAEQASIVTLGTTENKISFALGKAVYGKYYDGTMEGPVFSAMAASQAGTATFRFVGSINSNVTWLEDDITAKAVYTFKGKSDTNYAALTAKPVVITTGTNAHAMVETVAPEAPVVDTAPSATLTKFAVGTGVDNNLTGTSTMTVDLGAGTLAATSFTVKVVYKVDNSTYTLVKDTDYTYDVATKVLTMDATKGVLATYLKVGDTATITFNDQAVSKPVITLALK